ncbi:MAG: LptA/OstA family protein [Thermodesulfovibrionales bacterium]
MLRQRILISLSLLLLLGGNSFAETSRASVKGPITVTSESLTADNKAHTALFETNVVARTPDMSMAADKMLIFYREDGGEVTKIEATGNVRLIKESRVITAQNAIYYADEDKVVFTGEPKAIDGDNVVTGTKMTYLIKEDRSRVENSKVLLKNKRDK